MLDVDKVGLDPFDKACEAILDLAPEERIKELANHRCPKPAGITRHAARQHAIYLLVLLRKGDPVRVIVPEENRDAVLAAQFLGEVMAVDLHAAQCIGWEFV
jgi:hypothetical protein